MITALGYDELIKRVKERYDYSERRIVGIMFARPTYLSREIMSDNYTYWHHETGEKYDIFWAGYGEYAAVSMGQTNYEILDFPGNQTRVYFNTEEFIDIKNKYIKYSETPRFDCIKLVLVNYYDGNLHFDESFEIELEADPGVEYINIRSMIDFITDECTHEYDVAALLRSLQARRLINKIKKIKLGKALRAAIDLATLAAPLLPAP